MHIHYIKAVVHINFNFLVDVNQNDVDLFVNEIYSLGGSDLHAHATFNTSFPMTKREH